MAARSARPLLEDMLAYAMEALDLVGQRAGVDLAPDRMRFLAACRAVEIVGEAASRVPTDVRDAFPQIPFRQAAAMRNRLAHGYGFINADILADTVRSDFPNLIAALEAALSQPLPDAQP